MVPDDDRDAMFVLIFGQLLDLRAIRILRGDLNQMSPSEGKPHIIEKEQGATQTTAMDRARERALSPTRLAPAQTFPDNRSFSCRDQVR